MPADDILQVEGVASTSASDKKMHADEILHVEDGSVNYEPIKHENTGYEPDVTFGRKRPKTGLEKRLVWKQDLIIVPLLATVYLASFLVSSMHASLAGWSGFLKLICYHVF
jgi:hypothetical protein